MTSTLKLTDLSESIRFFIKIHIIGCDLYNNKQVSFFQSSTLKSLKLFLRVVKQDSNVFFTIRVKNKYDIGYSKENLKIVYNIVIFLKLFLNGLHVCV